MDSFDTKTLLRFGEDSEIRSYVVIGNPHLVEIGSHTRIDSFVSLTTRAKIGDYVHIAPATTIIGGGNCLFTMEHFSGMAAGCRIICGSDSYDGQGLIGPTIPAKYCKVTHSTVTLKRFVTLATNVQVLPGVTIGEGSLVLINSVVRKDLEPWGIYLGSKRIGDRPKERVLEYAKELGYE